MSLTPSSFTQTTVDIFHSFNQSPMPESVQVFRFNQGEVTQLNVIPTAFGSDRAKVILHDTPLGGDSDNYMTNSEIAYVNALWNEMPGTYSFYDTLCLILREGHSSAGGGNSL